MNSEINILDLPLLNSYNNRLMHHCRIPYSGLQGNVRVQRAVLPQSVWQLLRHR